MSMSRLIFAAAVSLGAALPLTSSGASAETTVIRSYDNGGRYDNGEGAVVVRRHSDHGYHHGWDRRREAYGMNNCRTVTVRRENDRGDVMVKRMRKCN